MGIAMSAPGDCGENSTRFVDIWAPTLIVGVCGTDLRVCSTAWCASRDITIHVVFGFHYGKKPPGFGRFRVLWANKVATYGPAPT